jgi:radical SAM superfamily enzyme YgiQ (UPF0313 family)
MSPVRVVEELAQLPPGDVLFTDDNFLADIPRVLRIIALIKQKRLPRRRFIIRARSDTIVAHADLIAKLKEVGLDQVFIGFEKTENQDLESVGKRNTVENNERALKILQSLNIGVYASFIVDPQFNETDFKKLAEYVKRLRISQPYFSVLTPLPGTELFEKVKEHITTFNYELYDLLHAVLPTKLPLPRLSKTFQCTIYGLVGTKTASTWKNFVKPLAASLAWCQAYGQPRSLF